MSGMSPLPVAVIIVVALLLALRTHRSHHDGERHGRGWAVPILLVVALVLLVLNIRSTSSQRAAVEGQALVTEPTAQPDVNQLWEQMNKPQIDVAPNQAPRANTPHAVNPSASATGISPDTARLLADMVVQVDALSHQLAEVAKEVAESSGSPGDSPAPQSATADTAAEDKATSSARPISVTLALKMADAARVIAKRNAASTNAAQDVAESPAAVEASSREVAAQPAAHHSESPRSSEPAVRNVAAEMPAEPRPDWVDDPPRRVGNIWREVIAAGEYETIEECYRAADDQLCVATWEHVQQITGQERAIDRSNWDGEASSFKLTKVPFAKMALQQRMGVSIDYIRHEIAKQEYVGTALRSVGPMKTLYTLVEFSPSVDHELRLRWEAYERTERFAVVGGIAGVILGVVGLAFGLLKIDTWTKGYYTKRLFLGVPAVIIGLVALVVLLVGP
jgi:hypothetical protein